MNQAQQKTADLLTALWVRNRPLIEERLATGSDHACGRGCKDCPRAAAPVMSAA